MRWRDAARCLPLDRLCAGFPAVLACARSPALALLRQLDGLSRAFVAVRKPSRPSMSDATSSRSLPQKPQRRTLGSSVRIETASAMTRPAQCSHIR